MGKKGLLKVFYDPDKAKGGAESSPQPLQSQVFGASPAPPVQFVSGAGDVQFNERFDQSLKEALSKARMPGYSEFLEMKGTLSSGIPDESTLLNLALKAAKLTRDQLLSAIEERKGIIEGERKTFHDDTGVEAESIIGAKKSEAAQLDSQVSEKKSAMASLEKEIKELDEKGKRILQEVSDIQKHRDEMLAQFESVSMKYMAELNELSTKISTHIKK